MWGFQLWVNLPSTLKMTTPAYQDIPADDVPDVDVADGVKSRVIAGAVGDVKGPVSGVATEPLYLDVYLQAGKTADLAVPATHNAFVYVYGGSVTVGDEPGVDAESGQIALLERDGASAVRLAANEDSRALLVAGKPIGESVARYGPFVMNTAAELQQAFVDYQSGRF